MEMYEVGGCVRDELLGRKSNDIDFSVVLTEEEVGIDNPFVVMRNELKRRGFRIFQEKKEFLTIRAQFPNYMPHHVGYERRNLTADFVLARKEGEYTDGRRPDKVQVGTLDDDLARRDFTMNAIAKAADGSLIDPFNGRGDIGLRVIEAVGDAQERLLEDALRAVRALRFAVTLGFTIGVDVRIAMRSPEVVEAVANNISDERIAIELQKMFRKDTVASLEILTHYPALTEAMFSGSVSLDATMKTKGRG